LTTWDVGVLLQVLGLCADLGLREPDLLEGLHVHQEGLAVLSVQVLHRDALQDRLVHLLARAPRLVDGGAGAQVLELDRTNAPPLPGLTCWNSTMVKMSPS
jgi:hypothetical protein